MHSGNIGTATLSKRDSILTSNSGNRVCMADNLTRSTQIIAKELLSNSLGEFDPVLWTELREAGVLAQSIGRLVYERVRAKIEGKLLK